MRHYFSFTFSSLLKSTLWSDQFIEKLFILFLLKHYLNNMYEIFDGLEGVG